MFGPRDRPAADSVARPLQDVARFVPDDSDVLVAATFACPFCLHVDAAVDIASSSSLGPLADCRCRRCAIDWLVLLDEAQLVRLTQLRRRPRSASWRLEIHFGWDWL